MAGELGTEGARKAMERRDAANIVTSVSVLWSSGYGGLFGVEYFLHCCTLRKLDKMYMDI